MNARSRRADVAVVGGGVIGLAAAWRLAGDGMSVAVIDPSAGHGASWVAAGMLAPVTEAHRGEEELLDLNLASWRRWPGFAAALAEASGRDPGYWPCGTLMVGADGGDRAWIDDLYSLQVSLGLDVTALTARAARQLEPSLAPALRGGMWAPGDGQVDNRLLIEALLQATRAAGVDHVAEHVVEVSCAAGRAEGVRTASGEQIRAPVVVLAAGWRTASLAGVPDGLLPAIRPVKGQIVRLGPRPAIPRLVRSVRGLVEGSSLYLVPRRDGSLVVGATVEEQGDDTDVTAGAVYELLRDARRLVPVTSELAVDELSAGLRPGSPDNRPLIGQVPGVEGLLVAAGHYRNGVLLAPVTAEALSALVTGGEPPAEIGPMAPSRFGAPVT
ncbi:MAG: glycine oxidase ThiO [Acidimicrobiales bacterium]